MFTGFRVIENLVDFRHLKLNDEYQRGKEQLYERTQEVHYICQTVFEFYWNYGFHVFMPDI